MLFAVNANSTLSPCLLVVVKIQDKAHFHSTNSISNLSVTRDSVALSLFTIACFRRHFLSAILTVLMEFNYLDTDSYSHKIKIFRR